MHGLEGHGHGVGRDERRKHGRTDHAQRVVVVVHVDGVPLADGRAAAAAADRAAAERREPAAAGAARTQHAARGWR